MVDDSAEVRWQVIGQSVRGASHERRGMPNQDALRWLPDYGGPAEGVLLAVADGHGSRRSPRSAQGSRFAVEVCLDLLHGWLFGPDPLSPEELDIFCQEALLPNLVERWRERVEADVAREPIDREPGEMTYLAYGSTLLAAAVTASTLLLLQLGDGDILLISDSGEVMRPLQADRRLFANETTSLCRKDAANDFRYRLQPLGESRPAMILLATDGYANSFADDAGFLQVGRDLHAMIRSDGPAAVAGQLQEWLRETSEQGSGDDITLGLVCRVREGTP